MLGFYMEARPATRAEVTPLARALAAAFEQDPVARWLMPDDRTRRRRLEVFYALEIEHVILPVGTAWTADGIPGAALVAPPGKWRVPVSQQIRHLPTFVRALGMGLPRAVGLLTKVESRHLREPHHYLAHIGVRPERQGQGLGSALIRPTLDRADAERLPCYLEASSPDNARLYRRLGFKDVETLTFAGSPPLALMRRDPV
jgi:ribosomal protein S18 acetylase RimI-like enzyme